MHYTTISYSGLDLDTFLGDSGTCYVTLTSAASGLSISRQNIKDWVKNHCTTKGIPVQVGVRKSMATAYPLSVLRDFLEYRVSLGDKQAAALVFATLEADLERSIKEANGIQVTAAQHEVRRSAIRQELIDRILDAYVPGGWLKEKYLEEQGLTKDEADIACDMAYIKDKKALIVRHAHDLRSVEYWEGGIALMNRRIAAVRAK